MIINWSFPIIHAAGDAAGTAVQSFRDSINSILLLIPITGIGPPEGNVEARLFQLYLDKAGGAGAIEYMTVGSRSEFPTARRERRLTR